MHEIIEKLEGFTGDQIVERSRGGARKKSYDTMLEALQESAKEWVASAVRMVAADLPGMTMVGKASGDLSSTSEVTLYKGGEEMVLDATVEAEALVKPAGLVGTKFTFTLQGEKPKSFELSAMDSYDEVNDDIAKFVKSKGYSTK